MLSELKRLLYFPLANYFKFFASIKLARWNPRVIVITGSVGKTTLFELLKSQIPSDKAYFAEHVNSAFGIPANILGLKTEKTSFDHWLNLFLSAPSAAFSKTPSQKIYIVEADSDRPNEGKLLASLLKPEVTIWVSSTMTHSANFDNVVKSGEFKTAEEAIAFEFGYFAEYTSKLVTANTVFSSIKNQLKRTKADVVGITKNNFLKEYKVNECGTEFKIENDTYKFPVILPEESFFSIAAARKLVEYLGLDFDPSFKKFLLPPGRGSIFQGINKSIIIDSSYNASKKSVIDLLDLALKLKKQTGKKIVFLLGDMRELGDEAESEHKEVAEKMNGVVDVLYSVGPLTRKFVIPNLKEELPNHWFRDSKEAGEFIKENLPTNSILLVKGSQNEIFLEEAIKPLLKNSEDEGKLPRQDNIWMDAKKKFFRT